MQRALGVVLVCALVPACLAHVDANAHAHVDADVNATPVAVERPALAPVPGRAAVVASTTTPALVLDDGTRIGDIHAAASLLPSDAARATIADADEADTYAALASAAAGLGLATSAASSAALLGSDGAAPSSFIAPAALAVAGVAAAAGAYAASAADDDVERAFTAAVGPGAGVRAGAAAGVIVGGRAAVAGTQVAGVDVVTFDLSTSVDVGDVSIHAREAVVLASVAPASDGTPTASLVIDAASDALADVRWAPPRLWTLEAWRVSPWLDGGYAAPVSSAARTLGSVGTFAAGAGVSATTDESAAPFRARFAVHLGVDAAVTPSVSPECSFIIPVDGGTLCLAPAPRIVDACLSDGLDTLFHYACYVDTTAARARGVAGVDASLFRGRLVLSESAAVERRLIAAGEPLRLAAETSVRFQPVDHVALRFLYLVGTVDSTNRIGAFPRGALTLELFL